MKKALLFLTLCLCLLAAHAQWPGANYLINFENDVGLDHLFFDPSQPNNVWQIGTPQKTVFTTSYPGQKVIATDTLNSYPVNDTSYFVISDISGYGWGSPGMGIVTLFGSYWVDSDSLSDYGTMEISLDSGITWINLIDDTAYASYVHWDGSPVPVLTGRSGGWKHFSLTIFPADTFYLHYTDPVLWRFGFISDGTDNGRDGLMYDDLIFGDHGESVPEYESHDLITIFPNPVSTVLRIQSTNVTGTAKIQVYNAAGEMVMENSAFAGRQLDVHQLQNGIYLLRYTSGDRYQVQRFVVSQ